jgi:hypothetical protein
MSFLSARNDGLEGNAWNNFLTLAKESGGFGTRRMDPISDTYELREPWPEASPVA